MQHIFLNKEETLELIINYVNDPKNALKDFKAYIQDIAKENNVSLKKIKQIYQLKNNKIEYELLQKYSKQYYDIDIAKINNCKNVNIFIKNYINILNTHILEFNFFINNLKQLSIKNWILLLEYGYDYSELDTVTELLLNNATAYKIQQIQKRLSIVIDKDSFDDSYENISDYFSA